jgi:hypothetical protein
MRYSFSIVSTLLASLTILSSCFNEEPSSPEATPLVVEGWIERGERPIVMVTHSLDMTSDTLTLDGVVEKWCRVSIFDNEEQFILYGKADKDYIPSFIFTSSELRGVEGHTYRLRIETESDTIEAESTLRSTPVIESLTPTLVEGSDSLYTIKMKIKNPDTESYYKIFSKTSGLESRFYSTFLGTFSGREYDERDGIDITRGVHSSYDGENFNHYFRKGDQVTVKLCTMERSMYEFWKVYDNNVSLSGNMFFTFTENCPHTFTNAFGYWCAYGMSKRSVVVR